jgi:hypothetical protein
MFVILTFYHTSKINNLNTYNFKLGGFLLKYLTRNHIFKMFESSCDFRGNAASKEHLELASYIKEVHHGLRSSSTKTGFDQAWREHCSNSSALEVTGSLKTCDF